MTRLVPTYVVNFARNYLTIIECFPRQSWIIGLFIAAKRRREGTANRTAQVKPFALGGIDAGAL